MMRTSIISIGSEFKDGDRVTWEMSCCGQTKLFHGTVKNPRQFDKFGKLAVEENAVESSTACIVFDDEKGKNDFIDAHKNHPELRL